jgi:predicted double-glycine peptidase
MVRHFLCCLLAVTALVQVLSNSAYAGEVITPDAVSGTAFEVPVKSMKELRESRTVHQTYDFSCGAAAVATLLTFSYDMPTTEREAFDQMWQYGDQEHIRQYGFSLLDMQKYLESKGLHAAGYRINLDKLRRLHIPVIALINPNGYNHFVVVRGWRNGAAIVADPMLGLRRITAEDFSAIWNGVVFLLRDKPSYPEAHYNDPADFKLIPRSFVSGGMRSYDSISEFLINIPMYNDH